jgi:beta-barrel assembly-enhancing protease
LQRPTVIAALALAGLVVACSTSTRASDDWPDERENAALTARRIELEWPLAGSGPVTQYVRELGAELGRASPRSDARWRFTVVRDLAANAFAIGDGRIYVTEGVVTFADDEAEVAAVIAHEMGHELAGHLRPQRRKAGYFGGSPDTADATAVGSVTQPLDPAKEMEADRISLGLLERAGYDPRAALTIAERLTREAGNAGRHFTDAARIERLRELLAGEDVGGRRDSERFRALKSALAAAARSRD